MPPILFTAGNIVSRNKTSTQKLGVSPFLPSIQPILAPQRLWISGVTKDSTGIPLAGVLVSLFLTIGQILLEQVISDGNGNYAFSSVGLGETYFVVAYKAGSPDVAGTTRNDLIGV